MVKKGFKYGIYSTQLAYFLMPIQKALLVEILDETETMFIKS